VTSPRSRRTGCGSAINYLRCWEGVLYVSFIIDVFSRMVVGWQPANNMRATLVLDALRMALGTRAPGADFTLTNTPTPARNPDSTGHRSV
jgi:transposase InsO family protein